MLYQPRHYPIERTYVVQLRHLEKRRQQRRTVWEYGRRKGTVCTRPDELQKSQTDLIILARWYKFYEILVRWQKTVPATGPDWAVVNGLVSTVETDGQIRGSCHGALPREYIRGLHWS